jgi:hypothetical protein
MKRVALAVTVAVLLLAAVALATRWSGSVGRAEPMSCDATVPLRPVALGGAPWQQHRHWLYAEQPIGAHLSFLVWNRRTDEWFRWLPGRARGGVRIPVPTRYADFVNRHWQDDIWVYCLTLTPDPPFVIRRGGFATSAHAEPVTQSAGATATIAVSVLSDHNARVLIDVELYSPTGVPVARWTFDDQTLTAREEAPYPVVWQLPEGAAPGLYTVEIGVFDPNWGTLHHWNDGTAVLAVGPAP